MLTRTLGLSRAPALALMATLALAGCATAPPGKPRTLDQILQDEGSNPVQAPMYLMGKDGTFTTNGLTPEPSGDTH